MKFPCRIVVAPCEDLRFRYTIEVKSFEQIVKLQRLRFEIIEVLDQEVEG